MKIDDIPAFWSSIQLIKHQGMVKDIYIINTFWHLEEGMPYPKVI